MVNGGGALFVDYEALDKYGAGGVREGEKRQRA